MPISGWYYACYCHMFTTDSYGEEGTLHVQNKGHVIMSWCVLMGNLFHALIYHHPPSSKKEEQRSQKCQEIDTI